MTDKNEKSIELSAAFGLSLTEPVAKITESLGEVGLDTVLDEGLLKDIPLLSTAVSVYRIGNTVRERQHIRKLLSFLKEVNSGIVDDAERIRHSESLIASKKRSEKEIEYVLLVIDRYISEAKSTMLGRLYLSYLRGRIQWHIFTLYAEIIDRLLPGDYRTLQQTPITYVPDLRYGEKYMRLVALGLMGQQIVFQGDLGDVTQTMQFERTRIGDEFIEIIGKIT